MKNLLLTTALVVSGATVAVAQTADGSVFTTDTSEHAVRASDFIGMRVYASENALDNDSYEGVQTGWEDIGEINDVILTREGEVQSVLVDIGGFLGIGERQVAIDMDAVKFVSDDATDADDYFLVLNADRATIEGAPEFTYGSDQAALDDAQPAPEGQSANADQPLTDNQPEEMTAGAAVTEEQSAEVAADQTMVDDNQDAADPSVAQNENEQFGTDETAAAENPVVGENPEADLSAMAHEGYSPATTEYITAENLTGARVYDANDEWIGEVSMFLLGESGADDMAVVDVGGFLGIGEKPVALDVAELDILQEDEGDDLRIYVSMTKDELEALPTYEK